MKELPQISTSKKTFNGTLELIISFVIECWEFVAYLL